MSGGPELGKDQRNNIKIENGYISCSKSFDIIEPSSSAIFSFWVFGDNRYKIDHAVLNPRLKEMFPRYVTSLASHVPVTSLDSRYYGIYIDNREDG